MIKTLLACLLLAGLIAACAYLICDYLDKPVAYFDYNTQQCIIVYEPGPRGELQRTPCNKFDFNREYIREWGGIMRD